MMKPALVMAAFLLTNMAAAADAADKLVLVRGGRPAATVVVSAPAAFSPKRGRKKTPTDRQAAGVLVDWIRKMTGAELPLAASVCDGQPAIYVGSAAVAAGLRIDDIESPSGEGLRIVCDGRRILLAGQNETATLKAACRLLEEFGCRYFIDHPLGEVYPRTKTLSVGRLNISEKPGFVYRRIWGSRWSGNTLWKTWNGAGGLGLTTGHAWGRYVSKDLFATHPEYFPLYSGQREQSDWFCTSNPGLREVFANGVIAAIQSGKQHPSLSPPDGRAYCQCDACRRMDDPKSLEPSSGTVNVTNRFLDFHQHVAKRVARVSPDSILSFYCYADYTQPPTNGVKLEPNLCAWIAPIRYCRFHHIGHPHCPSRSQLAELIDGWAKTAGKIAYRTYNYNLAEVIVPVPRISVWKHDVPYLKSKGCIGINFETLANWQIYAPHIYLSIRLAYDPDADADAVLDDFFLKFYGPDAGSIMKDYWYAVDKAFDELRCHSGSVFALHLAYTPELLARCRQLMDRARQAAGPDKRYAARVQMADEGLKNAEQYIALRDAMNAGDLQAAKRVYDLLLFRSEAHQKTGLGNHYTVSYLKRFVGRHVEAAAAATAAPNKVLRVLPDRWRLKYDPAGKGIENGYHTRSLDDSSWKQVATFGSTLDAQGLPDRKETMWYRTTFDLKDADRKLALLFVEVDGAARVYVNGREVGQSVKNRTPFEVDITPAAVAGRNVVAVRVDYSRISELFLGGIIRPVVLFEKTK